MIYKVKFRKTVSPTDFPAMSEPNYEMFELGELVTEIPVQLKEKVNGRTVIEINHTKVGTILIVI